MYCNHCGAKLEPGSQFCPSCGAKVGQTQSIPALQNNQTPPAPQNSSNPYGAARGPAPYGPPPYPPQGQPYPGQRAYGPPPGGQPPFQPGPGFDPRQWQKKKAVDLKKNVYKSTGVSGVFWLVLGILDMLAGAGTMLGVIINFINSIEGYQMREWACLPLYLSLGLAFLLLGLISFWFYLRNRWFRADETFRPMPGVVYILSFVTLGLLVLASAAASFCLFPPIYFFVLAPVTLVPLLLDLANARRVRENPLYFTTGQAPDGHWGRLPLILLIAAAALTLVSLVFTGVQKGQDAYFEETESHAETRVEDGYLDGYPDVSISNMLSYVLEMDYDPYWHYVRASDTRESFAAGDRYVSISKTVTVDELDELYWFYFKLCYNQNSGSITVQEIRTNFYTDGGNTETLDAEEAAQLMDTLYTLYEDNDTITDWATGEAELSRSSRSSSNTASRSSSSGAANSASSGTAGKASSVSSEPASGSESEHVANPEYQAYTTHVGDSVISCPYPTHFVERQVSGYEKAWALPDLSARMYLYTNEDNLGLTIATSMEGFLSGGTEEYRASGDDWYAARYRTGSESVYRKCFIKADGKMYYFQLAYPTSQHALYDQYVTFIEARFGVLGN